MRKRMMGWILIGLAANLMAWGVHRLLPPVDDTYRWLPDSALPFFSAAVVVVLGNALLLRLLGMRFEAYVLALAIIVPCNATLASGLAVSLVAQAAQSDPLLALGKAVFEHGRQLIPLLMVCSLAVQLALHVPAVWRNAKG